MIERISRNSCNDSYKVDLYALDMDENIGKRIKRLLEIKNGGNQSELARFVGVTSQAVQQWIADETSPRGKNLTRAADFLGVSPAELRFGDAALKSTANAQTAAYTLESAHESNEKCYEIEYWDARGSCGGGVLNGDTQPKGKMVKEASWFTKFGVRPHDAMVVYADGDSMADFIVDGDMVIFNRSKITPKSGSIFLIEHPDGLRIKQLRREIDGTWVLESRNSDKRKFPDERIQPSHHDLLVIKGEFVYRQGG